MVYVLSKGGTQQPTKTPTTPKPTQTGTTTPVPDWAKTAPLTITDLLRQLSANVGTEAMPGAPVGGVVQAPYGSNQPAQMIGDPTKYGETGGEADFFTQTIRGGMVPISAAVPGITSASWNPFKGSGGTTTPPPTTGGSGHSPPIPGPGGGTGTGGQGNPTPRPRKPRVRPATTIGVSMPRFGEQDYYRSLGLNPYRPGK